MKIKSLILFGFLFCWICNLSSQVQSEIIYKQIGDVKLKMIIYRPDQMTQSDTLPVMIFFFGGGWETGNISQFNYYAQDYAKKGIITVLADYRISSVHGTTPFESLKDAKSAVRYLKQHANELQIDTTRLIAAGGSAGGHLAAACFTNETINEESDPMEFTSKPKILVLFNPVIDNSIDGYGYERLGDKWEEFSPLHNVRSPFPPTLFLLGTKDNIVPVSTAQLFKQKIEDIGGRCDLVLYEGLAHGFFNQVENRKKVVKDVDLFLQSVNCLPEDTRLSQNITFPLIPSHFLSDNDFDPGASSSSGLQIEYTSGNQNVATIVNDKIRITGIGSTLITANQQGNEKFMPAESVSKVLVVLAENDRAENYWIDINFTRDSVIWKNIFPELLPNGLSIQSAPNGDYNGYSCTGAFGKFAVANYSFTPINVENLNEQFVYAFRLGTGSSSQWTFPVISNAGSIKLHVLCGNATNAGEFSLQKSTEENVWEDFNPPIKFIAPAHNQSTMSFLLENELNIDHPIQLRIKGPATRNVHIYCIQITKKGVTSVSNKKLNNFRFQLSNRYLTIESDVSDFCASIFSINGILAGKIENGDSFHFEKPGVYLVKIKTLDNSISKKILII